MIERNSGGVSRARLSVSQFEPSAEQLERKRALRRFNVLTVYLPVGIASVLALAIVAILLVATFSSPSLANRIFISALADTVIILFSLPLLLLCAVVPVLYVVVVTRSRQRRALSGATAGRLQLLMWQIERFVDYSQDTIKRVVPRIAAPFISAQARAAYIESLWRAVAGSSQGSADSTGSESNENDSAPNR